MPAQGGGSGGPARPGAGRRASAPNADRGRGQQDESIYNVGAGGGGVQSGPTVKTYQVSQPVHGTTPRVRMHADSSQVSAALNPVHGVRDAQLRAGVKPPDYAKSNRKAVREQSQLNALRRATAADEEALTGSAAPSGRNFVAENRLVAAAAASRAPPAKQEDDGLVYLSKRDYGRVPSYLLHRKAELAEAAVAAERAREAALVPPGMRIMGEEERAETLAMLVRNRQEVERAIQALPIIIETPSAIRRKNDLELRLKEIEDATKVFSRPKVLVAVGP